MKIYKLVPAIALLCTCKPKTDTGKDNPDAKSSNTGEANKVISDSSLVANLKFAWDGTGEQLINLSDEEKRKLNEAAPVLGKLAASPKYKKQFWSSFSYNLGDPQPITWQEAEKRLRKGEFRIVDQSHSMRLILRADDFAEFVTIQQKIDQAYAIIKEIDPKGVFIDYGTQ